jgi:hypothetical protein
MATDFRAAFSRLCEVLQAMGSLTAEESHDLLQEVQKEYEQGQVLSGLAVAFGRKPG